ncbi:MAG TPA: hypothetical protein VHE35_29580 [Kofleriaceae bacterium]|nr:hypothetical protein [Kofleriaceae bacterium]
MLAACTVGSDAPGGEPADLGPDAGAATADDPDAATAAPPEPDPGDPADPDDPGDPGDDSAPADPQAGTTDALGLWHPRAFTATRFAVFYQVGRDVLATYADPETGLPHAPHHAYIISISHASVGADRATADRIHDARDDFFYAPAFDLNNHPGWATASDAQLRTMAHAFRDEALAAHADLWSFNEAPTTTAGSPSQRRAMIKLVRYLADPNAAGTRLRGVFYLTHKPSMPSSWTSHAPDFWAALDETTVAVVAEHYHGQSWVCGNSEAAIADHLFALRRWLASSGDPHQVRIANQKFTVLHSSRYADGPSGWEGADARTTTLAQFQHALSKLTRVTRNTDGGKNRISFAPMASSITDPRVQPRITLLLRWHYGAASQAATGELPCVAGAAVNCTCQ